MSRRKQANPKPLKVDEERVGQESVEKGHNSIDISMKEENSPKHTEAFSEDYDDEFCPLVIDTSADKVTDEGHTQSQDAVPENEGKPNTNSIINKINNVEGTADHVDMVNKHNSFGPTGQSTPVSFIRGSQSCSPSIQPSSPASPHSSSGSGPSSPHRPVPGRRGKKLGVTVISTSAEDPDKKFSCPVCPEVLETSHELTKHIRSHNTIVTGTTSNNMCTICGKVLSSQSSLDRHMLVHSGERPFKCKICKMAFTTNGNMHRHMRIHGKEGDVSLDEIRTSSGRKPRGSKSFTPKRELNVPSMVGFHVPMLNNSFPESSFPERKLVSPAGQGEKRQRGDNSDEPMYISKRRISYNTEYRISSPSSHDSNDDLTKEDQASSSINKSNSVNHDGDPLHCQQCGKSFLCKYGMESHLETHTCVSLRCHTCSLSFRTQRGLQMHKLLVHSNNQESKPRGSPINIDEEEKDTAVGFHDLDFMEFSNSKFSLAAKSFCERNPRQPSSNYHNFSCKHCTKTFPCKSALKLHECGHIPEKLSSCPICQCEFEDSQKLHVHMIKHLSDKALADCQEKCDPSKLDGQDSFMKHNFLAYLDLKSTDDLTDQGESISSFSNLEKRQNNDYFAKLGQVYSSKVASSKSEARCERSEIESRKENRMPLLADHLDRLSEASFSADFREMVKSQESILNGQFGSTSQLSPFHSSVVAEAAARMSNSRPFTNPISAHSPIARPTVSTPVQQLKMLGGNSMNKMHAVSLGAPVSSTTSGSPLTDDNDSGAGDHIAHDKVTSKGMFVCRYCDQTFTNYRALKGHTRTHLGLSPYKCNLCSYSSADKSTLIRHLRTHNGERPFQCLVCDFAFTTKANCERHVRKKHCKVSKEDVEKSIGYNKFVSSDSAKKLDATNFHSPDTVCKYCGVDFKFFRALKHHLRSHSSCRQKPFLCQKCGIGFSTKANCVRHIQKQHLEVAQNLIEQYIQVNEPIGFSGSVDKDVDQLSDASFDTPFGSACSSPNLSLCRVTSTPNQQNGTTPTSYPSPRPAHSTPATSMPTSNHPMMQFPVKVESMETSEDQPLDFSMKPEKRQPLSNNPIPKLTPKKEESGTTLDELPVDLSIKKEPGSIETNVSKSVTSEEASGVQCQHCPRGFSSRGELDRHQKLKHSVYARGENSALNKTTPSISSYLSTTSQGSAGSGSDCELASIHKMMDVTDPHKFQAFFQVPDSLENSPMKLPARAHEKKPETMHLRPSEILRQPLRNSERLKISEEKLSPSESVDENFNRKSSTQDDILYAAETTPTGHKQFSFNDGEFGNCSFVDEMDSNMEVKEDVSDAVSLDSSTEGPRMEGEGSQQKKKRNSYADSPHKLHCPYCPRTFPWVSSLTRHLLTHTGQKPFKCPRCPVTFSTKSNRERHLIRKHGVNMLDPASRQTMDRPFKCHLCIFSSFSTKSNLLKHYHDRHPGSNVPEAILRGEHSLDANDSDIADMEESQMTDNSYDVPSEPELEESPKLDEDEVAKVELVMHDEAEKMPAPVSNRPLNPERDNYNVDKITECWKCGAKFQSRKLLVRHLKEHNIDFPFKCYLCDASFETRRECLFHQERVHSDDWPQLREKNKVDDIETFSSAMEELVSKNYKGGDLDGNDLDLAGGDDLHLDAATSDYIQRKVYCSLCPKRFWSLQDLRRHMRSHTGEKPFECDMCQKRFTLKHSMMRHRKKHFEMPDSMSASDDEDSTHGEETGLKGGERKSLVIESVLNRIRANQEHQCGPGASRDKKRFNGDIYSKKQLTYFQERKSPVSGMSSLNLDPLGGSSRDILEKLLGVEDAAIDEMLESADSAAERLGVKQT